MSEEHTNLKKEWTDEERLALAERLEEELDVFIDGLEKKRYEEGWPEDRWQEEMDKHPFFMKNTPQPGDEVHPMFEGLQKLKYDPEENTAEELALNYKEDGNFYMKHKKFRTAIISFTEGLKVKCENPEVNAVLYNNRSAAHYFLFNFRSALIDAQIALRLKPDYAKARWRAAQCAHKTKKYELCTKFCNEILECDENNKEARDLLKENKKKELLLSHYERRELQRKKSLGAKHIRLVKALEERGVKFVKEGKRAPITEKILQSASGMAGHTVHLDEYDNKTLVWSLAFLYPKFSIGDYQVDIHEDALMETCVSQLFEEPLPWDRRGFYREDNVNVYYEDATTHQVHLVDLKKTVGEISVEKTFYVTQNGLEFYVLKKDSREEREFLSEKRKPFESKWFRVD
ncbi:tetratricopeptide repeat protein 4 isoform X2 [Ceratitis capitata]|uniref:Tetratricopeptide repeat protein 4 n=2 Tax=Ceratitis capitata TaxID=7213 RepID=W8BR50_CERCA|nr:tetratricopeptide repeat protein 4 isoform X2 [Ceratitis capitata]XP_004534594.1 tetratricopeptide repeat protein 4 isoform X2 [Ceratitis capitata]XP_020716717.1 tetratricopeptide repeat protein 4 isoform X2 [Ceratitis capitata]